MTSKKHDLVVIGAGPGGYVAAIRAAQLGLDTACIDREAKLGGTCLRVGCIPSKALLESSERYVEAREGLARHGITAKNVSLNLKKLMGRKERIVGELTDGIAGLFKDNKVTRYHGTGRITGPGKITVSGQDQVQITAEHILIATGSRSANLPGVEMDGDRIGDSTTALSYPKVPEHLIVIGAGYIGLELGSVWRRLGARVSVLEYLDRILPGMDGQIARQALRSFKKQGLEFFLSARVTGATTEGDECVVTVEGSEPFRGDRVLVAVGRKPVTDDLGLEAVGIVPDERGFIPVDANFATSVPGVFAVGDVIGGAMLAHKAEEEGVACVERIATGSGHVDYDCIPGVAYTHPEIAGVGKIEEELKEAGIKYRKGLFDFRANSRARCLEKTEGRVKILADAETDRVLGVHILGPRAGDLIAEAAVAMAYGASSEDIARACHAHPTLAEAVKEAALAVDGRAIHA